MLISKLQKHNSPASDYMSCAAPKHHRGPGVSLVFQFFTYLIGKSRLYLLFRLIIQASRILKDHIESLRVNGTPLLLLSTHPVILEVGPCETHEVHQVQVQGAAPGLGQCQTEVKTGRKSH